ncbi:hypothetical protein F3Y22_tig00002919pilonHSYRG00161 [Hibiscus syriacus]|uniref:J domain-containing protein n=1 Tax=Hibiscus syriacus TaxID=106335 RepID=A0A6A3CTW0_HIBSY|nr:hypothetical protein F3Y22_tig00002919pilonHSYRG00161 [Hibiscus syriacus]
MSSRPSSAPRPRANASFPLFDGQNKGGPEVTRGMSVGSSSSMKKASSANIVDDLSYIFGAAASSSGAKRQKHWPRKINEIFKCKGNKLRDKELLKHYILRSRDGLLGKRGICVLCYQHCNMYLWPECGWQPFSSMDLITAAAVKKAYRKATLCIHPDKVQQKGANLQQKYISEKVFDLLKEAWNKFNSEELF